MSKTTTQQAELKRRYKVGSRAFFEGLQGFEPKDTDEVDLEAEPRLYKNVMQFRKKDGTRCLFKWRRMSADEFIEYAQQSRTPMEIGKFLVPELAQDIGLTIEHLRRLEPVAERLDSRHSYEKIILQAYIQNGGFFLTADQREEAYQEYKRAR